MEFDEGSARTLGEVERIMHHAKLERTEVKPMVQCLRFASELDNDAIQLIEVNESMLQQIDEGASLVMRGLKTDCAVLCTKDSTFEVRGAETSNTMLLVPSLASTEQLENEEVQLVNREVCALKHDYYELRPIKPRLKRLKHLLEENVYSGRECEQDDDHQGRKYTFDEMTDQVQASDREIYKGLRDLQACEIAGYWRMLEFDLVGKVLQQLLNLVEEQSWRLEEVPLKETCDVLQELYPRTVVENVLLWHSDNLPQDIWDRINLDQDENFKCRLSEDKICRYYAELILRPVFEFNLAEFTQVWQLTVPEGMNTALYQVEGLALVNRDCKPEVIRYMPVINLPEDVCDRFTFLFKTKEKWTMEEITPFIKDLTTAKVTVGSLLLKYARAFSQDGIKLYNSKKPVN